MDKTKLFPGSLPARALTRSRCAGVRGGQSSVAGDNAHVAPGVPFHVGAAVRPSDYIYFNYGHFTAARTRLQLASVEKRVENGGKRIGYGGGSITLPGEHRKKGKKSIFRPRESYFRMEVDELHKTAERFNRDRAATPRPAAPRLSRSSPFPSPHASLAR